KGSAELNPGMVALIEGGTFYQLENIGDGPMVLMGTRTGPNSANQHINFDTKTDMRAINRKRKMAGDGSHVNPE
ncbi:MAG: hypothetical protein ACKVJQ_01545, partial [Alphaproteobacteria bacterium]